MVRDTTPGPVNRPRHQYIAPRLYRLVQSVKMRPAYNRADGAAYSCVPELRDQDADACNINHLG